MSLVFAVTVLLINFILWIILLSRFRGLFDTGDIVDKTRSEITELTRDLNRVAQRDIALFNECVKQLHEIIDEADKKVAALRDEVQKLSLAEESLRAERERLKALPDDRGQAIEGGTSLARGGSKKKAVNSFKKTKKTVEKTLAVQEDRDVGNRPGGAGQKLLFDNGNINVPALQGEGEYAAKTVTPFIYLSDAETDAKAENKADVTAQVMAMARSGFPPEQIAERLSCSLTEVQMILDMSLVSGGE